jgi:hypothetical protein
MNSMDDAQKILYLLFGIWTFIVIIVCFYTSYNNLILKRFSKFGFDRFMLIIFVKKSMKKQVEFNQKSIKRSGIVFILIALGGLFVIFDLLSKPL